ncbi:MAG: Sua5/YciO/YrdC/YwlC family protein [Planctomycetota bacterium]
MAELIELATSDREEALCRVLEVLDQGGLVLLPTETVYGLGGRIDRPEALDRLRVFKGHRDARAFTLHVGSPQDAFELGADSPQARRLARTFWPGPLTLVLDVEEDTHGFAEEFGRDTTLGLRVVAEAFTAELLARCPVPLILSSANPGGHGPPASLAEALPEAEPAIDLAVDGGPAELGVPSSVVHVSAKGRIRILREGAVERTRILSSAATLVLFVCSGNTCRSPMAEALASDHWARCLGYPPDELIHAGLLVTSAGTATLPGMPASPDAIEVMAELGLDLGMHRSRALEPAMLARASRVYCMNRVHLVDCDAFLDQSGGPLDEFAEPPRLLAGDEEIPDPFGGGLAVYREIRDRILRSLDGALPV